MSSLKKFILLILSLSLIICQETNTTEPPKEKEEKLETKEAPKIETIKVDNSTTTETNYTESKPKSRPKRDFKSKIPFNMTIDEMDIMMLCTMVVQESVRNKKNEFEELQKKLNLSTVNPLYEKIGTDIFEKCNKEIDIKLVNTFMKNLTYLNNFKWVKEFDEITKIDYDKYLNQTDLSLNIDQQILMYKYQRVDELYRQKRADERDNIDKENQKLKIGEIDMDSIPNSLKFGVFLVILILLFGGIFYLLKKLEKKPKDKKKKDKKKKIQ